MNNSISNKRLTQIYTGNGKGKTTAALGLALRACSQGWKVIMIQFVKGNLCSGEARLAKIIPNFEFEQYGLETFVKKNNPSKKDIRQAYLGFKKAQEAVLGGKYDLVILDEINIAVNYKLVPLDSVVQLLEDKPEFVELVLTGRYAHKKIIEMADLVSEIKEIKHPFRNGIPARKGIEY
jgi:cob(I)alamin adenosyltransferase